MTTVFTQPINLCIDYLADECDRTDPYAHRPPAGRTASIVRLMTDKEMSLSNYQWDEVVSVEDADMLWDAINANLEYVLWKTPTLYNMDCERLTARGIVVAEVPQLTSLAA